MEEDEFGTQRDFEIECLKSFIIMKYPNATHQERHELLLEEMQYLD